MAASKEDAGPLRASQGLTRAFVRRSEANVRQIQEDLAGNLELQGLVMATIEEYKTMKHQARGSACSVTDMVMRTLEARKRKAPSSSEDSRGADKKKKPRIPATVKDVELRRGQHVFNDWSMKLTRELLLYIDCEVDRQVINVMSSAALKQAMEHVLDLRVFGDRKDRVGSTHKPTLFASLKRVYEAYGFRLRTLEVDAGTGEINWDASTKVTVTKHDLGINSVSLSFVDEHGKTWKGYVTADTLQGDPGPFRLASHWSLRSAVLKSSVAEYPIAGFFSPRYRKLAPRKSDAEGATARGTDGAKMSADEADKLAQEKKAIKKKAKLSGVLKLAPLVTQPPQTAAVEPQQVETAGQPTSAPAAGEAAPAGVAAAPSGPARDCDPAA